MKILKYVLFHKFLFVVDVCGCLCDQMLRDAKRHTERSTRSM